METARWRSPEFDRGDGIGVLGVQISRTCVGPSLSLSLATSAVVLSCLSVGRMCAAQHIANSIKDVSTCSESVCGSCQASLRQIEHRAINQARVVSCFARPPCALERMKTHDQESGVL